MHDRPRGTAENNGIWGPVAVVEAGFIAVGVADGVTARQGSAAEAKGQDCHEDAARILHPTVTHQVF